MDMNSTNKEHQAVHWIDGMKLSSSHFQQSDAFHTRQLQDIAQLLQNDYNYGLLTPQEGMRTSLDLDCNAHSDRFEISLKSCDLITRNGVRIKIVPDGRGTQQINASVNASDYETYDQIKLSVILVANPYKRVPVGEPDPEESPLRHPFSRPDFRMEIVPASLVNLNFARSFFLVIGRVVWNDRRFLWDENYVPPCATTSSHPSLESIYSEFDSLQNGLLKHSIDIMQTIHKKDAQSLPDYDPRLARNTGRLCESVLEFLADSSFSFKNQTLSGPPIMLVQQASRLAGRVQASLYLIPEEERERLLAYYYQWTEIKPNEFQQTLSQIAGLRYDHLDTMESLKQAGRFLRLIADLWTRLSRLKFMGQNEKNLVLGVENEYKPINTTTHSLLD
jgi:hypothetical protein